MHKHFVVLLAGSLLFAVLFVLQTRFTGHEGVESVIMVLGVAIRNAIRVIFLYGLFAILVFGHYVFHCVEKRP